MDTSDSIRLLAESVSPLRATFGERLTLAREQNCVQWMYEGQAVIVEFHPGDRLVATFVSAPVIDAVTAGPTSGVYRPKVARYQLSAVGDRRMVDDMVAFFSGVREPRFAFVGAYSPP